MDFTDRLAVIGALFTLSRHYENGATEQDIVNYMTPDGAPKTNQWKIKRALRAGLDAGIFKKNTDFFSLSRDTDGEEPKPRQPAVSNRPSPCSKCGKCNKCKTCGTCPKCCKCRIKKKTCPRRRCGCAQQKIIPKDSCPLESLSDQSDLCDLDCC